MKKGEVAPGVGRSRGGRTTEVDALADRWVRPVRQMLTGGNVADCIAAERLLQRSPPDALVVMGDTGCDSTAVRDQVKRLGAFPNIPPKRERKRGIFRCRDFYRDRNAIERMFGRLKASRRIATRCDRRTDAFLSAAALAATVG